MDNKLWKVEAHGLGLGTHFRVTSSEMRISFRLSNNLLKAEMLCSVLNLLSAPLEHFEIIRL
jgi:hypothetical protein